MDLSKPQVMASDLEAALNTYDAALSKIQASQPPTSEQVLAALNARDVVQAALSQPMSISADAQQQLIELDNRLKHQAHRMVKAKGVNFSQYRSSFHPSTEAWWWCLETEVPPHLWDRWDWAWRAATVAGWTANLGLLMDIVPRFLGAGTGVWGAVAVAFPSLVTLLQARSELTIAGQEGFDRLLRRLRIPKHFHEEARFGSTALLLLFLIALRVNFPAFSDWYNKRGLEQYQEGQLAGAESSYQQALAINPDNAKAHYNLGVLYEDLQEYDKAETQYQFAVKGQFVKAQNNLARLYILEDKPSLAVPLILDGLAYENNQSPKVTHDLFKNLGWAFLKQDQPQQAEKFLQSAIEVGESPEGIEQISNRGSAHCLLAQVYEGQQQKQAEAVVQWQQCCQLGSVFNPDESQWLSSAHKKLEEVGKSCDWQSSNP